MNLHVYTARMGYRGADHFDVTRKSGGAAGAPFAPSWEILKPALDARHTTVAMREAAAGGRAKGIALGDAMLVQSADAMVHAADILDRACWVLYAGAFLGEMRESYRRQRGAWKALLAREVVTLSCYCTDPEACHRTLLGREILPRLGAVYEGERPATKGAP